MPTGTSSRPTTRPRARSTSAPTRRCPTHSSPSSSGRAWPRPTRRGSKTAAESPRLRRLATRDLRASEIAAILALLVASFGSDEDERFTEEDWDHAVGGVHFVLDIGGEIVAHASVVEREFHVGGRPLRTGYVEAVATAAD